MDEPPEKATASPVASPEAVEALLERHESDAAARMVAALHVVDAAQLVTSLSQGRRVEIVRHLDPDVAANVLDHIEPAEAEEILAALADAEATRILDGASPDVAADILRQSDTQRREALLQGMVRAQEVRPLLSYGDQTAGGLMVPRVASIGESMTAQEAIGYLRRATPATQASNYVFVLDQRRMLAGAVDLWALVRAAPDARVRDLMNPEVITVPPHTDQEECAGIMARYELLQLPVVDDRRRLLGVILAEDIIGVVQDEATEDILRLVKIAPVERLLSPFRRPLMTRVPWLTINLLTVFLAASVINIFESTIARAAVIAVFLPMVASQGGVAGMQTLTLVTRGLALGELSFTHVSKVLAKEAELGLFNGVVFGVVSGSVAYWWKGDWVLGVVVGTAMVMNLVAAGIFGAIIPLGLRALRLDPALGSAVILTTVTDVAGFGIVLGLAAWWLV